jgi:hypothetical protein
MRCWNCGEKMPKGAKACASCEALVEPEPTEEEMEIVRDMLEQMPPEVLREIQAAVAQSETAEEFVNRIMIGECPHCGSDQTGSCENDAEIDDVLVARCFECGRLWCAECGASLDPSRPICSCWEDE